MKLIILKNNLVEGLNSVERSLGDNTNLPILKNILIKTESNKITITSTNLELAVKYFVPGKIIEAGIATVPFYVFNNIIKNLNTERITLEEKNKLLYITTDNYEASIHEQNPKDFPIIPTIQNKKQSIKINTNSFKEVLSSVIVASNYSDIRPEISGVLFNYERNKLTLVATDSFRLAEVVFEKNQTQSTLDKISVIVPLKTASELLRIINNENNTIEIFVDPNQILFQTSTQYIISRVIEGKFPEYETIIPKQTKTEVLINRQELLNAVNLTKVFSGRASDITIKTGSNKKFLEAYSIDNTLGENRYKISAKIKGDGFSAAFNWRYLLDGLKIYKSDEISLGVVAPDRPVVIKSPGEPLKLYIVMPVKT